MLGGGASFNNVGGSGGGLIAPSLSVDYYAYGGTQSAGGTSTGNAGSGSFGFGGTGGNTGQTYKGGAGGNNKQFDQYFCFIELIDFIYSLQNHYSFSSFYLYL